MNEPNILSFPTLFTQRLVLRQLEETDDEAIFSIRSNDYVNRYIGRPKQTRIEEARAFITMINNGIAGNQSFYWGISLKGNPSLIGTICLWNFSADRKKAELGYELHPDFQGRGIMSEAVKKVISFAFDSLGLSLLEANSHKENTSSTKLLLKNNFIEQQDKKDSENPYNVIYTRSG